MMFTIAPKRLMKMLKNAGVEHADDPRAQCVVHLQASRGRISLGCDGAWAEEDSVIWNDGQCRLLGSALFAAVSRYRLEPAITIDVKYGQLRIRHSVVPVLGFSPWTPVSETEQSDFATD
jgi:hypothetical protein